MSAPTAPFPIRPAAASPTSTAALAASPPVMIAMRPAPGCWFAMRTALAACSIGIGRLHRATGPRILQVGSPLPIDRATTDTTPAGRQKPRMCRIQRDIAPGQCRSLPPFPSRLPPGRRKQHIQSHDPMSRRGSIRMNQSERAFLDVDLPGTPCKVPTSSLRSSTLLILWTAAARACCRRKPGRK